MTEKRSGSSDLLSVRYQKQVEHLNLTDLTVKISQVAVRCQEGHVISILLIVSFGAARRGEGKGTIRAHPELLKARRVLLLTSIHYDHRIPVYPRFYASNLETTRSFTVFVGSTDC